MKSKTLQQILLNLVVPLSVVFLLYTQILPRYWGTLAGPIGKTTCSIAKKVGVACQASGTKLTLLQGEFTLCLDYRSIGLGGMLLFLITLIGLRGKNPNLFSRRRFIGMIGLAAVLALGLNGVRLALVATAKRFAISSMASAPAISLLAFAQQHLGWILYSMGILILLWLAPRSRPHLQS